MGAQAIKDMRDEVDIYANIVKEIMQIYDYLYQEADILHGRLAKKCDSINWLNKDFDNVDTDNFISLCREINHLQADFNNIIYIGRSVIK